MSAWGVRKPLRTYSRQKKRSIIDEEPPTKRRRVEIPSDEIENVETTDRESISSAQISSPTRAASPTTLRDRSPALFSDEVPKSTPPSSPLPPASSPPLQTRKPLFSFLKRNIRPEPTTNSKKPLVELCGSTLNSAIQPPKRKKRLVQMQLDLVGELRKTCMTCGMEYIPSNAEDASLHRKFHNMNIGGVDLTKAFVERLKKNQVWTGSDGHFVAVVRRSDALALRNKSVDILKVVNTELGAVTIPDEVLWSQIRTTGAADAPSPERTTLDLSHKGTSTAPEPSQKVLEGIKDTKNHSTSERFKVYLYIRGQKCVGACLAERIQGAYTVEDQEGQDDAFEATSHVPDRLQSSSIAVGSAVERVILGVSRIWTSNLHRKLGIASRLLDSARSDFLYGMTVEKSMVAFSQPTESGGQLARKWFGQRAGWHVYVD